jgi:hypothetical protein
MHKAYVEVTCIKISWSRDGHDFSPLSGLQNGNPAESTTQSNKKMKIMTGQWRGMLGRLDDRDHLE